MPYPPLLWRHTWEFSPHLPLPHTLMQSTRMHAFNCLQIRAPGPGEWSDLESTLPFLSLYHPEWMQCQETKKVPNQITQGFWSFLHSLWLFLLFGDIKANSGPTQFCPYRASVNGWEWQEEAFQERETIPTPVSYIWNTVDIQYVSVEWTNGVSQSRKKDGVYTWEKIPSHPRHNPISAAHQLLTGTLTQSLPEGTGFISSTELRRDL